jgi:hypothetical protein
MTVATANNDNALKDAGSLSKEGRAALRKVLRQQLETVRKKVRHMRAKNLLGEKGPGEDAKARQTPAPVAQGKADRDRDSDRGKSDRAEQSEKDATTSSTTGGEDLKETAEEFFSKGIRPKVGRTKSVVAGIMSSEQRSFAQDHRRPPTTPPKKKGSRRK